MASPINTVADELSELLLESGASVVTLSYPEFYDFSERKRIKEAFKEALQKRLSERGILIAYGASIVAVLRDHRFAPKPG